MEKCNVSPKTLVFQNSKAAKSSQKPPERIFQWIRNIVVKFSRFLKQNPKFLLKFPKNFAKFPNYHTYLQFSPSSLPSHHTVSWSHWWSLSACSCYSCYCCCCYWFDHLHVKFWLNYWASVELTHYWAPGLGCSDHCALLRGYSALSLGLEKHLRHSKADT